METWKDIPGYEGIYQASTSGNIRTVEGKITSNARCAKRRWKSRVLKGRGDYYATGRKVSLWKDGRCKDCLVARLVAITFLGAPPDGFTVNHIDGNRMNNAVENLEWLSLADNIRHGFNTGLYHSQKTVALERMGVTITFRSMAQADSFLNRSKGYTSGQLCKLRFILTDNEGKEYNVVRVGE